MKPGDWVEIPAHVRHRVESTQAEPPTVWLAVHRKD
jgi:cupin 2 domain-containing protein